MTAPPASPSPLQRLARFLPAGRGWWLVLGAILAGLLLFALVLFPEIALWLPAKMIH